MAATYQLRIFLHHNIMGIVRPMAHIEIVPDSPLSGTSQVRLQLPPGWSRFFALRNHGLQRTNEGSPARWKLSNHG